MHYNYNCEVIGFWLCFHDWMMYSIMQICGRMYWRVGSDYIKYLAIATGCLSLTHSLPSETQEPSNWNKH